MSKKLWKDYYSVLKPYCLNCLRLGITKEEYAFCSIEKEPMLIYAENWIGRQWEKKLVHTFDNIYQCNAYHWTIYQGQGKINN